MLQKFVIQVQDHYGLGTELSNYAKHIWFQYLQIFQNNKIKLISFFTVGRQGLIRENQFIANKYNWTINQLQKITDDSQYLQLHKYGSKKVKMNDQQQKIVPIEFNLIPSIIYLSLLQVGIPVIPSDIYKMIQSNTIHYFDGLTPYLSKATPIKLYMIKPQNAPSPKYIRYNANQIINLINLDLQVHPSVYIERFQIYTGMPTSVCSKIDLLLKNHRVQNQIFTDQMVIGAFVVFFKLMYGLNDETFTIHGKPFYINEQIKIQYEKIYKILGIQRKNDKVLDFLMQMPKLNDFINQLLEKMQSEQTELNKLLKYEDLAFANELQINNIINEIDKDQDELFNFQNTHQKDIQANKKKTNNNLNNNALKELQNFFDEDLDQTYLYEKHHNHIEPSQVQALQYSDFLQDEISFYNSIEDHQNINVPLPCDEYVKIAKEYNSSNQQKHQLNFIFNFFANLLQEQIKPIIKATMQIENSALLK